MAGRSSLGKRPAEVTAVERKLAGMAQAIGLALYTEDDMQTPPAKKRRSDFGGTHEHPHADLMLACKHYCDKKKYLYVATKTIKISQTCVATYTSSFPTGFPDFLFFEKAADQKYTILAVELKCGRDKMRIPQQQWFEKLRKCGIRCGAQYSNRPTLTRPWWAGDAPQVTDSLLLRRCDEVKDNVDNFKWVVNDHLTSIDV